jgi:hypothetical protein
MKTSVNYFTIILCAFLFSCSTNNENAVADDKASTQDPTEKVEDETQTDDVIQEKTSPPNPTPSVEDTPNERTRDSDDERPEVNWNGTKKESVKSYPGVDNDVAAFCTCVEKQSPQCEQEMEALEGHFHSGIKSYEAWKARALIKCPDAIESIERMK